MRRQTHDPQQARCLLPRPLAPQKYTALCLPKYAMTFRSRFLAPLCTKTSCLHTDLACRSTTAEAAVERGMGHEHVFLDMVSVPLLEESVMQ